MNEGEPFQTSKSSAAKLRRGFTMIEMLMVILVVTILIALLLPSVHFATEAARRTQCKNNLMQLTIAVHHYQASVGVLPPGCVNDSGPIKTEEAGYHKSWVVQILPMTEQQSLFRQMDFSVGVYDQPLTAVRATRIPSLICPSDSAYKTVSNVASTSYAGCIGGRNVPIETNNSGLLYLNSSVDYKQIRDGASNTIMFGERRLDDIPLAEFGWISGTSATLRNTGVPINATTSGRSTSGAMSPGQSHTASTAVVSEDEPPAKEFATGGYSSYHSWLAQFALADGSVMAIAESVDPFIYRCLGDRDDGEMLTEF